ncbi:hypothetical protein V6N11_036173 [Hibiscus sabdariffa]|uniref:Uncharacterized protein n=1 Tax=Hibiscus sabdariffa TaxID=183260 RepID=A0ABR2R9M4_9ROSI
MMEHSHRVWFSMVFMVALGLGHFSPLVDSTSRARLLSNYVYDLVTSRYHISSPSNNILASASLKKLSVGTLPKGVPIPLSGPSRRTSDPPSSPFEMLPKGVPIPPSGPSKCTSDTPPSPSVL